MAWLVLMAKVLDMLPIVSKESGMAHFKAMMSWTIAVEGGVVTTADLDLRTGLGILVGGWGVWALKAGSGR